MGMMQPIGGGRGGFGGGGMQQQGHFNPAFMGGQGGSGQYGANKRFKTEEG